MVSKGSHSGLRFSPCASPFVFHGFGGANAAAANSSNAYIMGLQQTPDTPSHHNSRSQAPDSQIKGKRLFTSPSSAAVGTGAKPQGQLMYSHGTAGPLEEITEEEQHLPFVG